MKKHNNDLDFTCIYCGKRYSMDDLREQGYVTDTKCGTVVECPNPKCMQEQLKED